NDVDVLKRAQSIYRDEHKGVAFCQETSPGLPKRIFSVTMHDHVRPANHDPPRKPNPTPRRATVEVTRQPDSGRAFEAQAEKDRTLMRLEELRFLVTSTKDLDDVDAYWIKKQKRLIINKMKNDLGAEDDEDEDDGKATCVHNDQFYLPDAHYATRWNRFLPKKVNIFIWRALRDRLPTRWNLSGRGIDLDSLYCSTCDASNETIDHTLFFCSLASSVSHRVFAWLDLQIPNPSNIHDFFGWLYDMRFSSSHKALLEVICGVVLWSLWNFRNETLPLVATFCLIRLLIVLIGGIQIETSRLSFLGTIGSKTL
nr:RNA-directed DNA polymerase, eukaryota [Tanacetum cinerariifolium]